jgi:hydrogenase maturation protein HypF
MHPTRTSRSPTPDRTCLRIAVSGTVQGVGFRPWVYHLATELGLAGWVKNHPQGVTLEVEGHRSTLTTFLERFPREAPAHSRLQSLSSVWQSPRGHHHFQILPSDDATGADSPTLHTHTHTRLVPDLATCPDCRREIFDPANRRYRYPFTNCTQCGPRFSIVESLPYDRARTSMRHFPLCPECQSEYDHPQDRRFHAQPTACPRCGPQLTFLDPSGHILAQRDACFHIAAHILHQGGIIALLGIGGLQLLVDATRDDAVHRLRLRKHRESKPLAVMFPDLASASAAVHLEPLETQLLTSPAAPIVLVRRHPPSPSAPTPRFALAPSLAPDNPYLGVLLPYSPLHHLLLADVGIPLVATSGNLGEEPICIDPRDALHQLHSVADGFLIHDRPIVRHVDDSVVRVVAGAELILRRARGYVPAPLPVPQPSPSNHPTSANRPPRSVLALGGHLKNTVAITDGQDFILGPHIGDLESVGAQSVFRRCAEDLPRLFGLHPREVAVDAHPGYVSTRHGQSLPHPVHLVQHHHAHILAVMAEHQLQPPILGVAWDGTGDGLDGTVWGGEFLRVTRGHAERRACLRPFRLPGGEAAMREPRRSALGLLHALGGDTSWTQTHLPTLQAWEPHALPILATALNRGLHAPWTSSVGRLFDAVASLLGLRQISRFEGDAAMALEFVADAEGPATGYPLPLVNPSPQPSGLPAPCPYLDWEPLIHALLRDRENGTPIPLLSARFHASLADGIVTVARAQGEPRVALGGGCFQNRRLTETTLSALRSAGFEVHWPRQVPPGDGGLALGQLAAVLESPTPPHPP